MVRAVDGSRLYGSRPRRVDRDGSTDRPMGLSTEGEGASRAATGGRAPPKRAFDQAGRAVHHRRNRMMARTKRSRRSYSAGEWGRNRVRVFPALLTKHANCRCDNVLCGSQIHNAPRSIPHCPPRRPVARRLQRLILGDVPGSENVPRSRMGAGVMAVLPSHSVFTLRWRNDANRSRFPGLRLAASIRIRSWHFASLVYQLVKALPSPPVQYQYPDEDQRRREHHKRGNP